ncbi:MAG: 50S ribosomal protein L30e [Candidatus Thorarchaeota archaeon]|nr:50S ribosomal protein L30e [Candidatus Thorarchaeota archaeon]
MSLNESIASAVRTGKCRIGAKSSIDAVKKGEAKMIVVARNCPRDDYSDLERYAQLTGVRIEEFAGTTWELGEVIGRPFMVSAVAVIDPGDSKILKLP